jgi:hypothetical protein
MSFLFFNGDDANEDSGNSELEIEIQDDENDFDDSEDYEEYIPANAENFDNVAEETTASETITPISEPDNTAAGETEPAEDVHENNQNIENQGETTQTLETVETFVPVSQEDMVMNRQVRTFSVFPEAPQIFRRLHFPEHLKMTDNLQQAIRNLEPFSIKNFDNTNFYIMTTEPMLFTPQLGGGDLSDLRNYRTRLVETVSGVKVNTLSPQPEYLVQYIEQQFNAGEYITDILCVPLNIQSLLAEKGLLMNLNKIPFLNVSAPYYNQSAMEAATVNNTIFGVVSDALFDPSNIYAMFYNKDLIKKYELENPSELYFNNEWTYDNMFGISRALSAAAVDLNGDFASLDGTPRHPGIYALGFNKENNDIINGMFMSGGNTFFDMRRRGFPVLNFNNGQTAKFVDALSNIFSQPEHHFLDSDEIRQHEFFSMGNILFTISTLDIIPTIAEIDFDWGILPVPTLDSNNSNGTIATTASSFVSKDALTISVLRNTPNTEICGFVTEAFSVSSYKIFQEVYMREQLMYTLRHVQSAYVLNDIINNVNYNQYNMYGTVDSFYGATIGVMKNAANQQGNFGDLYAAGESRLNEFFSTARMFDRN